MNTAADKNTLDAFSRELRQALQRITGKVLEPEDLPVPVENEKPQDGLPDKDANLSEAKTKMDDKNEQDA